MPTAVKPAAATPSPPEVSPSFIDTLKVALYSRYGGRKTLQIAGLIDLVGQDNVLIVSAEHGLNTIKSKVKESMVLNVVGMDDLRSKFAAIQTFARGGPSRWVCCDGMSQIMEWIANEHLGGADRYYEATTLGRQPNTNDMKYGKYINRGEINTMAIYGKVGRDSELLISEFIKLPCNLYANYLEDMTGRSGFEAALPYGPDVPGKVGLKAVMSSFDYIGRLFYNQKGELTAGFDPASNFYMARTREDRDGGITVPAEIANFSLADFVKLVTGEQTKEATT